jgi:hypothetical protein
VGDQEKWIFFHHFSDAVDIDLAGRGGLDHSAPIGADKIIQVLLQAGLAPQLWVVEPAHQGVLSQLGKAFFQSAVDKVEIAQVAAVGPFIHHSLQETLDKHHVLGHGVGLLGALPQLGRQAVVPVTTDHFFYSDCSGFDSQNPPRQQTVLH